MEESTPVKRATRLWALVVALIVLGGAAVVGWERWGAAWLLPVVTSRIEAATGLRLAAEGRVASRLFPTLGLHAAGVRLVAEQPADGRPLLYADAADVELSWVSLLHGDVTLRRVRLSRTRILAEPLQPPVDIDIDARGPVVDAVLSAGDATIRARARRDGDTLALDHVALRVARLGLAADGAGRLSLRDPVRLVVNAGLSLAGSPAGAAAAALSYSSDGLVLERATWRRADGLELSLFGHAAPSGGLLRFEGGIGAASDTDKRFDAAAEFDGAFGPDGLDVSVSNIDVRTGEARLTGRAVLHGGEPDRVNATLRLDRLDVAAISRSPLAPLAAVVAELGAASEAAVHLRVDQLIAGGRAVGEGIVFDGARHGGTFDLHELAARSLGGAPVRASGRLALGPAGVAALDPVRLTYGAAEAEGRLRIDLSGARPLIAGDLTTGPLQLDQLFAGPPPLPPEPMTRRELAAAKAARRMPAAAPARIALGLPASLPIDADITLASPRIAWRGYRLDDVHAGLRLREHELGVTGLTAALYGGRLALTGDVKPFDQPHMTAQLQLVGADLRPVLSDLGAGNIAAHGDVSAELAAEGGDSAALVATLAGKVTLEARDGEVTGVDLPRLAQRLKEPQRRPVDILQLARIAAGGSTPFTTWRGHFRIDRGVARTDDLQLTGPEAAARIRGSIDLAHRTLDLVSEFEVTDPPAVPPLIVTLDGGLAAPRRVFDISRLQSYLLHRRAPAPPVR